MIVWNKIFLEIPKHDNNFIYYYIYYYLIKIILFIKIKCVTAFGIILSESSISLSKSILPKIK
jgi:hypothetical protein